jgi:hypothetical protein
MRKRQCEYITSYLLLFALNKVNKKDVYCAINKKLQKFIQII